MNKHMRSLNKLRGELIDQQIAGTLGAVGEERLAELHKENQWMSDPWCWRYQFRHTEAPDAR